ncbi:hypothetical protein AVEN_133057-1 [Araneus ventricosus]|uniref:Uncharacterized protein n=1 Tax=Araneus ventricosus TaxID=182803 RepID=A0A4Y2PCA0_ARAVE|nr:hypothetical protein AVEN_133057-1 [Araneus ventricosus]
MLFCRQLIKARCSLHSNKTALAFPLLSSLLMASIFWNRKGVLLVDFMPKGTRINAYCYCDTLRKVQQGMLSGGIVLLHDMPALTLLLQLKNCWINSDGKFLISHPIVRTLLLAISIFSLS